MMRCILSIVVLGALTTLTSATFLDVLKGVHASPVFNTLSSADQLMVVELLAEAEAGELKIYIDDQGFQNVLAMLDRLPEAEAHTLTQLLIQELDKEEHPAVGRRDVIGTLQAAMQSAAYQNLSAANQTLVQQVLSAAESGTLTHFIELHGYGEILKLVDILPEPEKHLFEEYVVNHLNTEAATIG